MDFHTLARKDLQALCKKNKIPANMTNMAMADALNRLQHVEGIDELLKPIDSETLLSPEKPAVASPEIPRTLCKTSTRRKPVKEDPASSQPLTRTRRGTRRTAGEEPEEAKTEVPETPAAPSSRKRAPVTSTRGKAGSREASQEESAAQQPVYSTRRSIRFTEKKLADLTLNTERRGRRKPIKIDDLSKEGSKRSLHSDGDEDNKDSHAVSDEDQDKADESDVVSAGKSSELIENANDLNDGDEVNSETNGNRADDLKGKPEEGLVIVDGSDVVSGSDQNSTKLIEKERDVEDQVHDENKEAYFGTNSEVGCDELNVCSEKAMVTNVNTTVEDGSDELEVHSEKPIAMNDETTEKDGSNDVSCNITELGFQDFEMKDETTDKDGPNDVSYNITELVDSRPQSSLPQGLDNSATEKPELDSLDSLASADHARSNDSSLNLADDQLGFQDSEMKFSIEEESDGKLLDGSSYKIHESDDLSGGSQMVSLNQLGSKKEPEIPECQPVEDFAHLGQSTDSDMILAEDPHHTQVPESNVVSEEESSGKVLDENLSNTEVIDAADDLPEVQTVSPDPGEGKSSEHKKEFDHQYQINNTDMDNLVGEDTDGKIVDEKSSETQGIGEDGVPEVGMVCSEHLVNLKENEVLEVKVDGELLVEKSFEIQESSRASATEDGMVCSEQLASFKETDISESSKVLVGKSFEIQESSRAGVTEDGMVCSEQLASFKETEISESSKVLVEKSFEIQESSRAGVTEDGMVCSEHLASFKETEISDSSKVLVEKSFEIQESSADGVHDKSNDSHMNMEFDEEEIDGKLLDEKTTEIQESRGPQNSMQDFEVTESKNATDELGSDNSVFVQSELRAAVGFSNEKGVMFLEKCNYEARGVAGVADEKIGREKFADECPQPLVKPSSPLSFVSDAYEAAAEQLAKQGSPSPMDNIHTSAKQESSVISHGNAMAEIPYSSWAVDPLLGHVPRPTQLTPTESSTKSQTIVPKIMPIVSDNKENIGHGVSKVELRKEKEEKVITEDVKSLHEKSLRQLTKLFKERLQIKQQAGKRPALQKVEENRLATEKVGSDGFKVKLSKKKRDTGKDNADDDNSKQLQSLRKMKRKDNVDNEKWKPLQKKRDTGKDDADDDNLKQLQSLRQLKVQERKMKRNIRDNVDDDKSKQLQSLRQLKVKVRKMKRNIRKDNVVDENLKPLQKKSLRQLSKLLKEKIQNKQQALQKVKENRSEGVSKRRKNVHTTESEGEGVCS